ncbi:nitroreductase family protein [Pseudorhodoplanes sp.]|uniref:nitroreductase family protein n=1 Tax=Pseudorhodoplanes sp. TaxID=1934341 RepID=UPI003D0D6503
MTASRRIEALLQDRFGEPFTVDPGWPGLERIESLIKHRVIRRYSPQPVDAALIRLICACALSAPSKSDLQLRDVVVVENQATRQEIAGLIPDMPWIGQAPVFLVFLGNGRRIMEIARLRTKPFPNNHFDLVFNAATDAAIALATAVAAAEAMGLGACPISVIRDHAARVGALLDLPERVIPFAGLCIGWPADEGRMSPRLPLAMTVHRDRFDEENAPDAIDAYDRRREQMAPYRTQRDTQMWGETARYGWSEDKARQYAQPQRGDFGAYVRSRGFSMD